MTFVLLRKDITPIITNVKVGNEWEIQYINVVTNAYLDTYKHKSDLERHLRIFGLDQEFLSSCHKYGGLIHQSVDLVAHDGNDNSIHFNIIEIL